MRNIICLSLCGGIQVSNVNNFCFSKFINFKICILRCCVCKTYMSSNIRQKIGFNACGFLEFIKS